MPAAKIDPGDLRFVDNYIPVLPPGDYEIDVSQNIAGTGLTVPSGTLPFQGTQKLTVAAPRFQLPASDIQREFPPPNSQGQFANNLPHIVLTKRALPWERDIFADSATPWLALLLLDPADADKTPGQIMPSSTGKTNATGAATISLSELTAASTTILGPQGLSLEPPVQAQADQLTCQAIEISPQTFSLVVPSQSDLKYLAHCRLANLSNKAIPDTVSPAAQKFAGMHFYSVVMGSRFPQAPTDGNQTNIVHLVSLEGFQDYIPATPGATPTQAIGGGFTSVRLVSLASWTFTALQDVGQSFSQLMNGLVPPRGDASLLQLRFPVTPREDPTPTETTTSNVLSKGYSATGYATRQGEQTLAWYRGPFTPQLPAALPTEALPLQNSAQAAIYDATTGVFNHSYAAAFETGRLVAINSKSFGALLLRWRRSSHQLVDLLHQRIQHSSLSATWKADSDDEKQAAVENLRTLLKSNLVSETFITTLVDVLGAMQKQSQQGGRTTTPTMPDTSRQRPDPVDDPVPINSLADLMEEPAVQLLLREMRSEELAAITGWLTRLYLLYGVPFNTLVPAARMLPPESIRFFYVDDNWLLALLNGALSIGVQSSRDSKLQHVMGDVIVDAVKATIHTIRDRMLGIDPTTNAASPGPMAGLLLRSAVVSGWPGLEVSAQDGGGKPIKLLRMSRLAGDVLLCLFPEIPAAVAVEEPREGLHFGLEDFPPGADPPGSTKTDIPRGIVPLRYLDDGREGTLPSGGQVGAFVGGTDPASASVTASTLVSPTTSADTRVLDIDGLLTELQQQLGRELGPADFALEMIDAPEQMTFEPNS